MMPIYKNKKIINSLKFLRPVSRIVMISFPNIGLELKQIRSKVKPIDYTTISLFMASMQTITVTAFLFFLFHYFEALTPRYTTFLIILSISTLAFSMLSFMSTPKLQLKKRIIPFRGNRWGVN